MNDRLSQTTEYLFYREEDAYSFLEEQRQSSNVISSFVKFKKPTKSTSEGWIVNIKIGYADLKELLTIGE